MLRHEWAGSKLGPWAAVIAYHQPISLLVCHTYHIKKIDINFEIRNIFSDFDLVNAFTRLKK